MLSLLFSIISPVIDPLQCYSSSVIKINRKEQYLFQRLPGYEIGLKWLFGTIREKFLGKIVIKVYIIGMA